ncbi:ATP-binding protein [Actinomadura parmotrematis]|uniref:ATP-binding protein n=1 Tax=Actinomadura parmotrematis TaxID=2864039 RepID=A0ABS7FM34_9ACTN|nr:ATP-binding protein [Actinomadura parmotrematis]MBW8481443.1 ATP-binding protein [Actinomadura parmotrematis]
MHAEVIVSKVEELAGARAAAAVWAEKVGADADQVKVIVSELAGNALIHTNSTAVTVRAYVADRGPVLEVWDESETLPVIHRFDDPDATSGRGLAMVQIIARTLSWRPVSTGGKCVTAVLRA